MHLSNPYPIFSENVEEKLFNKLKNLPIKERLRCIALHHIYKKKQKLDAELEQKINKLKLKYEEITIDIIKSQNMIISGETQKLLPYLDNIEKYMTSIEKNKKQEREQRFKEENVKYTQELLYDIQDNNGIKGYWQRVIKNCKALYQKFDVKADQDLMQYLQKVNFERDIHAKQLILSFEFDLPRDRSKLKYYPDKQPIKKIFHLFDSVNPIKTTFQGSFKSQKQKNKNSFLLNFFQDNKDLNDVTDSYKKEKREKNQQIYYKIGFDYEIALIFIEEIIPYSLEYFLGIRGEYPHNPKPVILPQQEDVTAINNNEQNNDNDCQIY